MPRKLRLLVLLTLLLAFPMQGIAATFGCCFSACLGDDGAQVAQAHASGSPEARIYAPRNDDDGCGAGCAHAGCAQCNSCHCASAAILGSVPSLLPHFASSAPASVSPPEFAGPALEDFFRPPLAV